MFRKILIANRGEIAVRIARACRELGVPSVAVYSEADVDALHVRAADEAAACGPARATESYLDGAKLVAIAKQVGADAIHPGYGFLSENAGFAEAIRDAGLILIGPTPEVIRTMGLKIASRERMVAAGVPVVPGGDEIHDLASAQRTAEAMGYPVLVKASAGGGGRGMRRVDDPSGLEAALARASSEAETAFGNGSIYLEKCLEGPRHIEIQIMADAHGRVVHLGERECSIQRRHQKLVEEAPAFGMTPSLREAMGEAAVRAARAVDYVGAGTVEFLVDSHGDFYFLEMNTRIQVEHPVTEAVTGVDLVATQIRVAAGEPLGFDQSDVRFSGHAIEARVYAEDPDKGFVPSPGRIVDWRAPSGPGVRLDAGFEGGQTVTPHYDPMIAKLIVHGRDRAEALERLERALDDYWIAGIRTGLPFLRRLVRNAAFRHGAYDTGFIETHMQDAPPALAPATQELIVAAVAWRAASASASASTSVSGAGSGSAAARRFEVALPKSEAVRAELLAVEAGGVRVRVGDREVGFTVSDPEAVVVALEREGETLRASLVARGKGGFDVGLGDRVLRVKCEAVAD